jgi:hypothetical protein
VHLDGFIIKKFVTMHGHMNVKFINITLVTQVVIFKTAIGYSGTNVIGYSRLDVPQYLLMMPNAVV